MSLLRKEPAGSVRTLPELFALAFALEKEAATRYDDLARKMHDHHAPDTAAVFERLAEEERKHRDHVSDLSQQRTGAVPGAADLKWDLSETFDDEATGELAGSRLATPYRALSMAVRNEERAFAFWTYVAANAQDAAVREAAETMAHEELEHVSLLRRERRRAYHAHRASVGKTPPRPASGRDILATAAELERHLADQLASFPVRDENGRRVVEEMAAETRQMASEASQVPDGKPSRLADYPAEPIQTAELLVERYLEAADHAADEAVLSLAQSLARKAIARLAGLRSL